MGFHGRKRFCDRFGMIGLMSFVAMCRVGCVAQAEDSRGSGCIVELAVPADASVSVDGVDCGKKRVLQLDVPGGRRMRTAKIVVTLADGERRDVGIVIRAGWRVKVCLEADGTDFPELVYQGGCGLALSVAFDRSGELIVTGTPDAAVVWRAATGDVLHRFELPRGRYGFVFAAFSESGEHVIAGTMDGAVFVWDRRSGKLVRRFGAPCGDVSSSAPLVEAFGPLVSRELSEEWAAKIDAGMVGFLREELIAVGFPRAGRRVAVSPSDVVAWAGPLEATATLWDLRTGRFLGGLEGHTKPIVSIWFNESGDKVLTGSRDSTAIVWDAGTQKKLRTFVGTTGLVAFAKRGAWVAAESASGEMIVWDTTSGEEFRRWRLAGISVPLSSLAATSAGDLLLAGASGGAAVLFEAWNGRVIQKLECGRGLVVSAALSPSGAQAVTGCATAPVLWDLATGRRLRALEARPKPVEFVTFSSSGAWMLIVVDETPVLWDRLSGRPTRVLHVVRVSSIALSPSGDEIIVASGGDSATLWKAATGEEAQRFAGHTGAVVSAAFSPSGYQVLTGSNDRTAVLWDAATGERLRTFRGHEASVRSVTFDSSGELVLTGSSDSTAILWKAATGEQVQRFAGHTGAVVSVAFRPSRYQVLTGSDDGTAVLWDAATGERLRTFRMHEGGVRSVTFDSSGEVVLTADSDSTAIIWDVQTARPLRNFLGKGWRANCFALDPSGQHVLTGSGSGETILWDVATGQELARIVVFSVDDWFVATPQGLFDGSETGRKKVAYRREGGLEVVPSDQLADEFYRPGLLGELLRGERPLPRMAHESVDAAR